MNPKPSFVFFGTPKFAETILDELLAEGFIPQLIVAQEDKPKGRHLVMTPPETKVWGEKHNVPVYQPKTLRDGEALAFLKEKEPESGWDLFIVAAYGKIIPKDILEYPKHKTLNVHPSLLPKLRGSSPIQGAILEEKNTGVTIMRIDEELDHGPIVAQRNATIEPWPPYREVLEETLAHEGGRLLSEVIPQWVQGSLKEIPQDDSQATYTKKISKEDALLNLEDEPSLNLRKIKAYSGWPNAYTFLETKSGKKRMIIKSAHVENDTLILEKVIPEGGKEMDFEEFKRGFL